MVLDERDQILMTKESTEGCDAQKKKKKSYPLFYSCFFHHVSSWEKKIWAPVHRVMLELHS